MRARESRKHELTRVRRAIVYLHSRHSLVKLCDGGHIREIELRIYSLCKHIERKRYDVCVTRSLTVTEKRTLDSVAACKQTHFGVRNGTTSIVVRME